MKNKIIIFDMDGVLFDTGNIAKESLLKSHPGMTEEMFQDINSGNYHEGLKKYAYLKKIETEEERKQRSILYSKQKSEMPMFQGAKELLEALYKNNYIITLNTNAYDRNCIPLLERFNIKKLFDFLATADISKDKVEKFKLIEKKFKVDKKEMLFITDALGDVRDANTAGVSTIAVTWGVHDASFFEREKYSNLIGIVNTIEELHNYIKKYYYK
jgi:HAD superfamily hydrolase (TIGR01509 family)